MSMTAIHETRSRKLRAQAPDNAKTMDPPNFKKPRGHVATRPGLCHPLSADC